jgi:hypothetical protein
MDVSHASLVPRRVATAEEAQRGVANDGAAILTGIPDQAAAIKAATAMLGATCVRVGTQFEATKASQETEAAVVAEQPVDERGRKRRFAGTAERMVAHSDGFGFGDFAPDYLFLWCERPDPVAGDSFLVDGLKLLEIIAAEHRELAEFCWTVAIDQSEPNFPLPEFAPIARRFGTGRVQIKHHPFQAPVPGPDEDAHRTFIAQWSALVTRARDTGPMFRVDTGEMICIDNYRVSHGRDGYTDPGRKVLSIWGWSSDAIAVPDGPLDIVRPVAPRAMARVGDDALQLGHQRNTSPKCILSSVSSKPGGSQARPGTQLRGLRGRNKHSRALRHGPAALPDTRRVSGWPGRLRRPAAGGVQLQLKHNHRRVDEYGG